MSSSESVQQVRDRIIQLAREIEQFSQSGISTERFFEEFLKRVVTAIGARAGAVWMGNSSSQLDLICELGLHNTDLNGNPQAAIVNQRLLVDVLANGQACTYSPDDGRNVDLPTNDLIVLAALQRNKECIGVVEIFQRVDTPEQARPGFLQFVEQMCGYACRYLDRQAAAPSVPISAKLAEQFEQFVLQLHRSLDVNEVAATAANDGRLLIKCDRLSVAVQYGRKTIIRAISGQDSVNQRANLVRMMTKMSTKILATRRSFTYTGKIDDLPADMEGPLTDYIQESGSRMVMVAPLFKPDPASDHTDGDAADATNSKQATPIGGLIVEQISESHPKSGLKEKVDFLADHVATALWNARIHQRLFLMPVWRFMGRSFALLEGRNLLKAVAVVVVLIVLVLAMVFVPCEYRVAGEGQLLPVIHRDVFAPEDGEVVEIYVKSKSQVKKNDPLLLIRNEDLRHQLVTVRTQSFEARQRQHVLYAQLADAMTLVHKEEAIRLQGEIVKTRIEIDGLQRQVDILDERTAALTVCAPINGVVATFQIEQLLKDRPVRRGEVLLEVKDDTDAWRLELEVEERRLRHILDAQKVRTNEQLLVEFILATAAEATFRGNVEVVSNRSNPSGNGTNVIQVFVTTGTQRLPNRRIGAEVRAKIFCGKKRLGYVLFGDVIEFMQKHLWL